ncbi:uncharacterized protein LOC114298058 [Camellia sinensis]|uniref:uncharacterized protein LOC114298058 n=1 Tax=Camellia sinensis TaxID=4442 RepID=UPI001036AC3C|nr:uncharacterized protein LOC114298058 [Camellia sinensis]
MADDAGPSYTVPRNASREAVNEIAREMVVETDHNLLEAYNSAATYYYNHYHRVPRNTSILSGRLWMYELFNGHQGRFEDAVSMSKPVFLMLCETLHSFGLTLPQREHGVPLEEKVAIFICALQGMKLKDLQERFQHSKKTLSRHFHEVLKVMIPFTAVHSRSLTPEQVQQGGHPHLQSQRRYRPYKDCIGALDGTHVMARVSEEYATSYYGRKGVPTQNILAVCDFDLCFTFVSAGKYYLVDSGYSNKTGYLAPYKGYRYHQSAHQNRRPQNEFELFNKAHSSLCSCIERTFGAWKSRWGTLRNIQKLSFSNQVIFVCASMALHNFIRRNSAIDEVTVPIANITEYVAPEMPDHDEYTRVADVIEEGDSDPAMTVVRANITYQLAQQRNTNN